LNISRILPQVPLEGCEVQDILNLAEKALNRAHKMGRITDSIKVRPGLPTRARFFSFWDVLGLELQSTFERSGIVCEPVFLNSIVDEIASHFDLCQADHVSIDLYGFLTIVRDAWAEASPSGQPMYLEQERHLALCLMRACEDLSIKVADLCRKTQTNSIWSIEPGSTRFRPHNQ